MRKIHGNTLKASGLNQHAVASGYPLVRAAAAQPGMRLAPAAGFICSQYGDNTIPGISSSPGIPRVYRKNRLCVAAIIALSALSMAQVGHAQTAGTTDPNADATTLDRLVVRSQLDAQERSVNSKRDADAIQDVVAADALGSYPDMNVGESLSRLPGLSVTRDQGEGRFVVVRGLDANLNSVLVDGVEMGTSEDDTRAVPLDVIPSDSTERVRVVKAVTPDMPGDAIGGSVQVETASAFDRAGRDLRFSLENGYQSLSGKNSPKGNFNYADKFAGNTIGLALGLTYQDRKFDSDNNEVDWTGDAGDFGGADGAPFAKKISRRKYVDERQRYGMNANLDFHPTANSQYFIRTLVTHFKDTETRHETIFNTGKGSADEGNDGSNGIYVLDLPALKKGAPTGNISKLARFRINDIKVFTASAGGENRLEGATIDYKAGYTKTKAHEDTNRLVQFDYTGGDVIATLDDNYRLPRISFNDDAWMESAAYTIDPKKGLRLTVRDTDDKEANAQINLKFSNDNSEYKFGVLGRFRDRAFDKQQSYLNVPPSDLNYADWMQAAQDHRGGPMGNMVSSGYLASQVSKFGYKDSDEVGNLVSALIDDYTFSEDITAAYAMGTWDIGNVRIIGGARLERTRFEAVGNDVTTDGDTIVFAPNKAGKTYSNLLPGLHLRWNATDNFVLRASVNKTISRPGFADVAPHISVDESGPEVAIGNPNLNPYNSTNFDLSLERYLGETGILSAGLFAKNIADYIYTYSVTLPDDDATWPGYDYSQARNGKKATVRGAEFNWQQNFGGLILGAGATILDTSFNPGIEDRSGDDFQMPRTSKHIYTGTIGYETGGLSTRLAVVNRSEYLEEIGGSKAEDVWVAANTQLDFSLKYQFTPRIQAYFNASNLLDAPLELYMGSRRYTQQYELYGRSYMVGVKVNL